MTRRPRSRIGILGGTFNPVHHGHLLIAQDAGEQARLEQIIFIPSATPPHKALAGNVSGAHRLRMLKLAIAQNPAFRVDDLELRRGGTSFTVDTVTELQDRLPDAELFFIMGADSLNDLHRWRDAERLVHLCRFIAVARPGFRPRPSRRLTGLRCQWVTAHPCEVSSREIRARIAQQKSIRYLVPDSVRRHIERHQLYR